MNSLGDMLLFNSITHSSAKSGLPSDNIGWCGFAPHAAPYNGHPVLQVHLMLQVASYVARHSGHTHRYFLLLLLATWVAGGLSGCHSADSPGSAATDWQGQRWPPLPSHVGQAMLPPVLVRLSALTSHSCCLPHPCLQPEQRSQTFLSLP